LEEKTRNSYRLAIMHTICLLMRVKFLKHTRKAPRTLQICVSQEQVDARDALFRLYLNGAKQSELYPALHKLLIAILCHHTTQGKLACPTDYSVCLTSLKTEKDSSAWNFKTASLITGQFSKLQYCLRMVFFTHCFSMAQDGPNYQMPSLLLPSMTSTPPVPSSFNPLTPPPNPPTPLPTPSTPPPIPDSILLEVEEQNSDEDTSEVIDSTGSQASGYDGNNLDIIDSMEDDIEIIDNEQDKNLLQ
jgi:hypothetical protein